MRIYHFGDLQWHAAGREAPGGSSRPHGRPRHQHCDGGTKVTLISDPASLIVGATGCGERHAVLTWAGHVASNQVNLWRIDTDGSNPRQLTQGMVDIFPVCSPDAKWVYYGDLHNFRIMRVSIEGGTPEVVPGTAVPGGFFDLGLDISRDGKLLAFPAVQTAERVPVHVIALLNLDAGTEPPRRISEAERVLLGLCRGLSRDCWFAK